MRMEIDMNKSDKQIKIDNINAEIEQIRERIPGLRAKRDQEALEERIRLLIIERDGIE